MLLFGERSLTDFAVHCANADLLRFEYIRESFNFVPQSGVLRWPSDLIVIITNMMVFFIYLI